MANRIITATVSGETIKLSNKTAGAAGSFNAVSLSLTFDSAWDGTTKKLYFFDAYGNNAVYILLTADLLVNGAYVVPIPAEPLAYAGEMTVTIKGIDFAVDGTTAERIIMSASTTMKVLNATTPASDVSPVEPTPTQAEQLQTQIDSILADIVAAAQAAGSATEAAASALAAATSKTNAETAESNAELAESNAGTHETNASGYATNASNSALAASGSATTAVNAKNDAETAKTAAELAETHAKTSETNAKTSETNAGLSALGASGSATDANNAKVAAQTAQTNAELAETHAETAEVNAETAETGAVAAKNAAESARDTAVTAKDNAVLAKTAAQTAQGLAETAKSGADLAKSGADTAKAGAESARDTAVTAKNDAVTAKNASQTAQGLAETAKSGADTAKSGADTAASTATTKATLSESYAKGGTGSRAGEDTDNAKYYKEQAAAIVGGDYPTKTEAFNVDNHVSGTTNKVYTATEQTKLAGISAGAEVNVNADWNAASGDAQILNKPSTMTPASHTHGNITNAGAIGSTANLPVVTTTSGVLTTSTAQAMGRLLGDGYGTCSTAAATAAKVVTCSGFALVTGGYAAVKFTNTDTSTTPTLNINSTGAKSIYYNGATITAGMINSAKTAFFVYNGTQYELLNPMPATIIPVATTSVAGLESAADKTKLDGIATGATNYTHPTGDGNLHVPATSTTNSGKVLTAGATAGSLLWTALTAGAQIATGSYTGTGTYGSGSPNTLTLSFDPKLGIVNRRSGTPTIMFLVKNALNAPCLNTTDFKVASWGTNAVTWYSSGANSSAINQLNESGVIYDYVAIG